MFTGALNDSVKALPLTAPPPGGHVKTAAIKSASLQYRNKGDVSEAARDFIDFTSAPTARPCGKGSIFSASDNGRTAKQAMRKIVVAGSSFRRPFMKTEGRVSCRNPNASIDLTERFHHRQTCTIEACDDIAWLPAPEDSELSAALPHCDRDRRIAVIVSPKTPSTDLPPSM
jgi:hypothetical protein